METKCNIDCEKLHSQNSVNTLMQALVVVSDALQDECYHSNVTTKWRIYHHKNIASITAGTIPQKL